MLKEWFKPSNLPYFALCVSVVALIVSMANVAAGLANFVLSRVRLLKVREIQHSLRHDAKGHVHHFSVDLLSYGAAIFDLQVTLTIFVRPSKKTVADGTVGTTTIELQAVGQLPNPLNAGKGAKFVATRKAEADEHDTQFIKRMGECLKAARLRDVYVHITCSEGRVTLKRVRDRRTHWMIDGFLGHPRGIKPYWWGSVIATWKANRLIRESKKWQGQVPSLNQRSGKNKGPQAA